MDENFPKSMSDKLGGESGSDPRNDGIDTKKFLSNSKNSGSLSCGILPVKLDSDSYNMNHKYRGTCLIFNNKEFEQHTLLNTRSGTNVDACGLYNCFRDLDFTVTMYNNATKSEILAALKQVASEDHSNNDCFACVILSHGHKGAIYGRDGMFRADIIFEPFFGNACPTLAGKPKLFFIEASQGDKLDFGTQLRTSDDENEIVRIPNQADILVSHSTVPGFYSWRNTAKGSWFIQTLCDVFENHVKEKELVEMLTMMNQQVAYNFMTCIPHNPLMHEMTQSPCFMSKLTRKVYFPIGTNVSDQRNDETDAKSFQQNSKNSGDPSCCIDSVEMDSDTYNMNHKYRGKCLIFSNEEFESHTHLNIRSGTDVDVHKLYHCFTCLGFNVTVYRDASTVEIVEALKHASCEDHSNNDCFVCVILSHGDEEVIFGRDGKFPTDSLFEPFLSNVCPTLAGKPKLFFIQASQGDKLDSGTLLRTNHDTNETIKIPNQADILVSYSSMPGFYSWRNTAKGSWFIQALCYILKNHAKEKELVEMLTMTNQQVAYNFESYTPGEPSMNEMKQVPWFTSRLTRKVYFPNK